MSFCASSTPARGLQQFLHLGVAQLDAALRDSDAHVEELTRCLAELAADLQQLQARAGTAPSAPDIDLAVSMKASLQGALRSLQFYDKLIQRMQHVRSGLAIPAEATADLTQAPNWNAILNLVRARYSMVEERVLFDFMMRGLRADQMLKALHSLREAGVPGEVELF
jgi:hypothetical protein